MAVVTPIRTVLAGSWRPNSVPHNVERLDSVVSHLLATGAHSLAWRQVRNLASGTVRRFRPLRDAYRQTLIDQGLHEDQFRQVRATLLDAGIDALLVKGWSVARLYPEPGLRPCGDIDLCVRPDQLSAVQELLLRWGDAAAIDLHAGVADLDRPWDLLWRHSRVVPLGDSSVRILGAEDQLRHLCLHLMRHGAFRPLWLCDVAVAVEARPADFDWDYCLAGNRRLTEWVRCALALARDLLDAQLEDTPVAHQAVPRWMTRSVLRDWEAGTTADSHLRDTIPFLRQVRHPGQWWAALRCRWPNPIEAAFKVRATPWTGLPLLWHQAQYAATRALRLTTRVRRQHVAPTLPFQMHQEEGRRLVA